MDGQNDAVTFTGEKDFVSSKERIKHIRDYEPCKTGRIIATIICGTVVVICLVFLAEKISFPRYLMLRKIENEFVEMGAEEVFCTAVVD